MKVDLSDPKIKTVKLAPGSGTLQPSISNSSIAKKPIVNHTTQTLMGGRKVVFILHGYGTTGVLRTKIRNWLKSERQLVKSWKSADTADGGDSFSRVELR